MNNKRLGIGFIGGGFITRFHIQSLLAVRDVDVIGVMSKTLKSAERHLSKKKNLHWHIDYLLNNDARLGEADPNGGACCGYDYGFDWNL